MDYINFINKEATSLSNLLNESYDDLLIRCAGDLTNNTKESLSIVSSESYENLLEKQARDFNKDIHGFSGSDHSKPPKDLEDRRSEKVIALTAGGGGSAAAGYLLGREWPAFFKGMSSFNREARNENLGKFYSANKENVDMLKDIFKTKSPEARKKIFKKYLEKNPQFGKVSKVLSKGVKKSLPSLLKQFKNPIVRKGMAGLAAYGLFKGQEAYRGMRDDFWGDDIDPPIARDEDYWKDLEYDAQNDLGKDANLKQKMCLKFLEKHSNMERSGVSDSFFKLATPVENKTLDNLSEEVRRLMSKLMSSRINNAEVATKNYKKEREKGVEVGVLKKERQQSKQPIQQKTIMERRLP